MLSGRDVRASEPEQALRVADGADGDRCAAHDRWRNAERGQWDRGDPVAERRREVLVDRWGRAARERRSGDGAADIAWDEGEVAGLDRDVCAGADRDAEVGLVWVARYVAVLGRRRSRSVSVPAISSAARIAIAAIGQPVALAVVSVAVTGRR
jgi:hypothetical protein